MPDVKPRVEVAIVDDHHLALECLARWINDTTSTLHVALGVTTWSDLITHPDYPFDVVLLDVFLNDDIPVKMKIGSLLASGCQVVIISTLIEPQLVQRAISAGALGYLSKDDPPGHIEDVVTSAAKGRLFLTPALIRNLGTAPAEEVPDVTPREQQVAALYSAGHGMTIAEVARELGISSHTAKTHLKNLKLKYAERGIPLHTRLELYAQLVHDYWILTPPRP
ncbi:response regulator transcription factor [Saxibacter everestensis]|uniref:Response regulator transcription factor n=1 Tax=Saxibacter everestensis TaxID=2909229 RepID=A0ABY8QY97_9MICO|nr:response regulator transcription factor [Brevibacteriaceae bacterium ZFBP1038]